jgi:hypothetical protein
MWSRMRLPLLTGVALLATALPGLAPAPAPPPSPVAPHGSETRPVAHRLIYPAHGPLDVALAQILPVIRMKGIRLEDAVDQLREQTGANLFVDWNQLRSDETPPKELRVDVDVREVSLADALTLVLRSAADGVEWGIEWGIEGTVIVVTDRARVVHPIRVYDVRDIVDGDVARRVALEGPPATVPAENERREKVARAECATRLRDLLIASVAPESWTEMGGSVGSVRELNGRLLIVQTWQNHRQLEALLDGLRRDGLDTYPTTRVAPPADSDSNAPSVKP